MNSYDTIASGALSIAQTKALEVKNAEIAPSHLLYGLIKNPRSSASKKLKNQLRLAESLIAKLPTINSVTMESLRPSKELSEWLTYASSHAIQQGKSEVGEADLLKYLPRFISEIEEGYMDIFNESEDEQTPTFLINLNELAESGKLDPVIGRSIEIRSVMEILGRRSKNNPVLVGAAGVGKTAIVEGLAESIVKGDVPDVLKDKTIYSLDMAALMAGTKFQGEFEERIQELIKFIKKNGSQCILFIDELHQLVGAGKTSGGMDGANLLKPALARGDLNCIGATTQDEYQKYILSDSALDRRFRPVTINEPSKEDSIEMLLGLQEKFESHHGIKISEEAIYSAVFLSSQYITNKNLPDKAIDLIDEASASIKISAETMPEDLVKLENTIRSKKIYAEVEKKDKEIRKEIDRLQKDFDQKKAEWDQKVFNIKRVSEIKNQLDKYKFESEQAERRQDYEVASQLKYSAIPELEKELEAIDHEWALTAQDIAQAISRQTGIPLEKILKSNQDKILDLKSYLKKNVLGQDEAIDEISNTLVAAHAGLGDETKPLGSFLLAGPSGVGKTETAKQLCQFLFNSTDNLIRLDMSEYSEAHSVAKLIGAPAGYVGYDDGGVLTEAVRRRPYSIILLDEIEKAHYNMSDILLQILDDGRLTDNKGRTIDFKNTIIIMTTNAPNLQNAFKPEVLGRLDAILEYKPITREVMTGLVEKQVALLNSRLQNREIVIELSSQFKEKIAEKGQDDRYGARPLASIFNKFVTRPLSERLIKGEIEKGLLVIDQ